MNLADYMNRPGDFLKGALLEEMDIISSFCTGEVKDMDVTVHEIRKSIKKVRAILRMIRNGISDDEYKAENKLFRDLNRELSEARNIKIYQTCMIDLKERLPFDAFEKEMDKSIVEIGNELTSNREQLVENEIFSQIFIRTNEAKVRINNIELKTDDFGLMKNGLQKIYKRARKFSFLIQEDPSVEYLHEYRKKIKYLWNQLLILQPVFERLLKAYAKSLKNLSDLLGDHRDYVLFLDYLEYNEFFALTPEQISMIREIISEENDRRLIQAQKLSLKIFIDKPGYFADRLEQFWNAEH